MWVCCRGGGDFCAGAFRRSTLAGGGLVPLAFACMGAFSCTSNPLSILETTHVLLTRVSWVVTRRLFSREVYAIIGGYCQWRYTYHRPPETKPRGGAYDCCRCFAANSSARLSVSSAPTSLKTSRPHWNGNPYRKWRSSLFRVSKMCSGRMTSESPVSHAVHGCDGDSLAT